MEVRVVTTKVKAGVSKLIAIKGHNIYCVLVYEPKIYEPQ
jgi:hypothetical protein